MRFLLTLAATAFGLVSFALPAFAQTRILSTTFGDVTIPVSPRRIVTTHYIATQPLLDLGVIPVGQGEIGPTNVPPAYWPQIADVPTVTSSGEPNYEQIVLLEPDLILAISIAEADQIGRLRQIAPVMLVGIDGPDRALWQNRVRQIADAVGKLDVFAQLDQAFTARQAAIKERFAAVQADTAIGIWAAWEFGYPFVFPSNTMVGRILQPAGARFAASAETLRNPDGEEAEISIELLGRRFADADAVFYSTNLDLSPIEATAETRALASYKTIPAVAAGNDFPLGKLTIAGFGDANAVLDAYQAALERLAAQ